MCAPQGTNKLFVHRGQTKHHGHTDERSALYDIDLREAFFLLYTQTQPYIQGDSY